MKKNVFELILGYVFLIFLLVSTFIWFFPETFNGLVNLSPPENDLILGWLIMGATVVLGVLFSLMMLIKRK